MRSPANPSRLPTPTHASTQLLTVRLPRVILVQARQFPSDHFFLYDDEGRPPALSGRVLAMLSDVFYVRSYLEPSGSQVPPHTR